MKVLPKLAIAATIALSSMTGMAFATVHINPNGTFNYTPAECDASTTRTAHPDWYRLGGYCDRYTNQAAP